MTMDINQISLICKILLTLLVCQIISGEPSPITNDINAMIYLQRFGYMNESGAANLIAIDKYQDAIKDFQRFSGINETGILDEETILMMNTPRCGNKDHNGQVEHARRRKRYALQGSKWRRTDLTYRISKYPRKVKKSQIDAEIARAFQVWSEVTPLNFIPKKDGRVHIDIKFVVGEHGDGDPFDGPGNTLAHAYFPQYGGDAHFDDEEYWTIDSYTGTNLFQVAAHELGHSLGLGHSSTRESLMAPFYQRYKPNFRLSKDDVLGIQSLYGPRTEPHTTTPPKETPYSPPASFPGSTPEPDISDAPDLCQDGRIDAVTRIADGTTYVFKGKHYWKVETNGLADGYPRRISDDWDGLPGDIDAALTWADGKTFIFKGHQYWRFHNRKMDTGYPKNISLGFAGIPNNIDTAFVWSGNGKTYFFKDKLYWRFDSKNDPPVSSRYPKPIKNWVGLPSSIDAAFKWENGLTYFFKGTNYYRFNDNDFEVDSSAKPPFPRQTSVWWFDCKSAANSPFRGSLVSGQSRSKFIGALMSNTMDDIESSAASSSISKSNAGSTRSTSSSSSSSSGSNRDSSLSDEQNKEWTMHGRFDHRDLAAAVYSHAII
ncbi:stromelysin-1 isoform X2 [Tetranychus urticae]|nr:stromelysin-1 isoform X2 [Tetranychus urticae]